MSGQVSIERQTDDCSPQLQLFSCLKLPHGFSNAIEIMAIMPLFIYSSKSISFSKDKPINPTDLICERTCNIGDQHVRLTIKAVNLTNQFRFPSVREEFVLDALLKICSSSQNNLARTNESITIKFTLNQISKVLSEANRGKVKYNLNEIKEALNVLNEAHYSIAIYGNDGTIQKWGESLISGLGITERKQWLSSDANEVCVARLHPMVSEHVLKLMWRSFNFSSTCILRSPVARKIHKWISMRYTQASVAFPFNFRLSTAVEIIGLEATRYADLCRNLEKGLKELEEQKIISGFIVKSTEYSTESSKTRRKEVDRVYEIYAHSDFVKDAKRANSLQNEVQARMNVIQHFLQNENESEYATAAHVSRMKPELVKKISQKIKEDEQYRSDRSARILEQAEHD